MAKTKRIERDRYLPPRWMTELDGQRDGLLNEGKARRILQAVYSGCETAADIEVELDFAMTRHQIAGHLSNLKRAGRICVVGEVVQYIDWCRKGQVVTVGSFGLVLADPPYSAVNAEEYGTPMIDRRRAIEALASITRQGSTISMSAKAWTSRASRSSPARLNSGQRGRSGFNESAPTGRV